MNTNPKVSIIVPVYNVEQHIERCARSIFEQTFKELQFIFVNDCTPDNSIIILKRVIEDYPGRIAQVTIISHEINQGVAVARNTGLDRADGEYFLQIDSDDWVEKTMIEELYQKAKENDSDIVWSDFYVDFPDNLNYPLYRKQTVSDNNSLCIINILSGILHAGMWNKLLRRNTCVLYSIRFPDGIDMCEDIVFMILFLLRAERINYLEKAFYHYFQNPDSITNVPTRTSFESIFKVVKILEGILPYEKYTKDILMYKARIKKNMIYSGIFSNEECIDCYPESNQYMYVNVSTVDQVIFYLFNNRYFKFARMIELLKMKSINAFFPHKNFVPQNQNNL